MSTFKVPERLLVRQIFTDCVTYFFDKKILSVVLESDAYQKFKTCREQDHFLWLVKVQSYGVVQW